MTEKARRNPLEEAIRMLHPVSAQETPVQTAALETAAERIGFTAPATDKPSVPSGAGPRQYRPAEPPVETTAPNVSWRAAGRSTAISLRVQPSAYEKFRRAAAVLRLPLGGMFEEMVEFYIANRGQILTEKREDR